MINIIIPILTSLVIILLLIILLFDPFKFLYKHKENNPSPTNGNGSIIEAIQKWAKTLGSSLPEHHDINNIPNLLNSLKTLRFERGLPTSISNLAGDIIVTIEYWLHIKYLNPTLEVAAEKAKEEFYKALRDSMNQLCDLVIKTGTHLSLEELTPLLVDLKGMISKWREHFIRCFECAKRKPSLTEEIEKELNALVATHRHF